MAKPRPFDDTHITINCEDCGKPRVIRTQDKHQVVRCSECQRNHRLRRRNELRGLTKDINGDNNK